MIFNPDEQFNHIPVICQLYCAECDQQYACTWTNHLIAKACRKCNRGWAYAMVDYRLLVFVDMPRGIDLN